MIATLLASILLNFLNLFKLDDLEFTRKENSLTPITRVEEVGFQKNELKFVSIDPYKNLWRGDLSISNSQAVIALGIPFKKYDFSKAFNSMGSSMKIFSPPQKFFRLDRTRTSKMVNCTMPEMPSMKIAQEINQAEVVKHVNSLLRHYSGLKYLDRKSQPIGFNRMKQAEVPNIQNSLIPLSELPSFKLLEKPSTAREMNLIKR